MHFICSRMAVFAALAVGLVGTLAADQAVAQGPAQGDARTYRKLAPGIVMEIPAKIEEEETFSGPREMTELIRLGGDRLKWSPNFLAETETLLSMAQNVTFRRQVWALEFGFKPMRMIQVDVPQGNGTVVSQKVYYLVYYVKNNGRHLNPEPQPDDRGNVTFGTQPVDHTIRFFPSFVLQAHDVDRAYLDDVIPAAIERIRRREDPNRTFYDSVGISSVTIPVSTEYEDNSVWGVATWTGVDPRSDFFSVFVQGLTNAYRWQDPPGAFQVGDPPMTGRRFTHKTLQVNFWRAGDAIDTHETEIRFGVPNQNEVPASKTEDEVLKVYRLKERVDYLWVYR
jgi:hypothetical protein